jgi:hypothetical protein
MKDDLFKYISHLAEENLQKLADDLQLAMKDKESGEKSIVKTIKTVEVVHEDRVYRVTLIIDGYKKIKEARR